MAAALCLASACNNGDCNDLGCGPVGIWLHGSVPLPYAEPLDVRVDACRNVACSQGAFLVQNGGTYVPGTFLEGDARVVPSFGGNPSDPYWSVDARYHRDAGGEFEDGDLVTFRIIDNITGNVVVFVEQEVSYQKATCGGCMTAEIA